jgi:ribosomal protein S14
MRAQAQLELSQMHMYTRSTVINNRCIEGGKGRGVFRDFKMHRVCSVLLLDVVGRRRREGTGRIEGWDGWADTI